MTASHLETPEFPLTPSEDADGPSHRQAYEIGCGAVVIRVTEDGPVVCMKLDRIGKEYVHHYLIVLDPKPEADLELLYIDPEERLFDCYATLEFEPGEAVDPATTEPQPGHAFENKDGHFIKVLDDPKTQKLYGFVDPATGLVRIRQERKLKGVHPNWSARAKIEDEVVDLQELLERFGDKL